MAAVAQLAGCVGLAPRRSAFPMRAAVAHGHGVQMVGVRVGVSAATHQWRRRGGGIAGLGSTAAALPVRRLRRHNAGQVAASAGGVGSASGSASACGGLVTNGGVLRRGAAAAAASGGSGVGLGQHPLGLVGSGLYRPPRHPPHFRPWLLELNGNTRSETKVRMDQASPSG